MDGFDHFSMKTFASIIVALVLFTSAHAQEPAELLEWNEHYDLVWEDFQGKVTDATFGDAGTAVQIKAKPFKVGKEIHYDVVAYFNREKSWARDQSQALLAHEQLHFDIAELYARKIRKKINSLSEAGTDDVKIFNDAIKKILLESNDADEQYDRETLHGAIPKRQAEWEKKVADEMKQLQDFKKKKRVIGAARLKKQPHIFSQS
jgi:hypothetical protein